MEKWKTIKNDYISRQDAIAALNGEIPLTKQKDIDAVVEYLAERIKRLKDLPAADVAEVVRCRDCKHFELDKPYVIQGVPILGHEVCNVWGDGCKTDQNGFCFMAERRTDEDNSD